MFLYMLYKNSNPKLSGDKNKYSTWSIGSQKLTLGFYWDNHKQRNFTSNATDASDGFTWSVYTVNHISPTDRKNTPRDIAAFPSRNN